MANYGVTNSTGGGPAGSAQLTASTSYQPLLVVSAASSTQNGGSPPSVYGLSRGRIYDILVGTNGTPADSYVEYDCIRTTWDTTRAYTGAVSSVSSAYALDGADAGFRAAVTMNASQGSSAAYSLLAEIWYVGVNQRASYRWVAAPGSELVWPANSSATTAIPGNALALRMRGTLTTTVTGSIMFSE